MLFDFTINVISIFSIHVQLTPIAPERNTIRRTAIPERISYIAPKYYLLDTV